MSEHRRETLSVPRTGLFFGTSVAPAGSNHLLNQHHLSWRPSMAMRIAVEAQEHMILSGVARFGSSGNLHTCGVQELVRLASVVGFGCYRA